jgi:hypothetical protein
LLVVAGPNGAGKTTITERGLAHEWFQGCEYINPDAIAQDELGDWNDAETVLRAAQLATQRREACLLERRSLAFETEFSAEDKPTFVRRLFWTVSHRSKLLATLPYSSRSGSRCPSRPTDGARGSKRAPAPRNRSDTVFLTRDGISEALGGPSPTRPADFNQAPPLKRKSPPSSGGALLRSTFEHLRERCIVVRLSCAGLQLDFPAQQFHGVTEVWVPFEEAIVIGWR